MNNEWPMISLRSNFTGSRRPGQGTHYSFCPAVACWEVVGFGRPLATSCAYPSTQVPKERTNPSSCTIGTLDVEHVEHVEHWYLILSSSFFFHFLLDVERCNKLSSYRESPRDSARSGPGHHLDLKSRYMLHFLSSYLQSIPRLQPWQHFIPLKPDLSDALERRWT
jgi:hypothetical protein